MRGSNFVTVSLASCRKGSFSLDSGLPYCHDGQTPAATLQWSIKLLTTIIEYNNAHTSRMPSNHFQREYRPRRRGWNAAQLIKALSFAGGIYIFWFIYMIQNLHSLDKTNDETTIISQNPKDASFNQFTKKKNNSINGEVAGLIDKPAVEITPDSERREPVVVPILDIEMKPPMTSSSSTIEEPIRSQLSNFEFNIENTQKAIDANPDRIKTLTAYVEHGPLANEIPGTRGRGEDSDKKDDGVPPQYANPLPVRKTKPDDLVTFEYAKVDSCHELQSKLPVDAGLLTAEDGSRAIPNTRNSRYKFDFLAEAKYCPVDADPFLPWIHDVFPSNNGEFIHFVAQNKRRCNTGSRFAEQLQRLEPQVALMQGIGVKKIGDDDDSANEMADGLWSPEGDEKNYIDGMPRYKLSDHEEADEKFTRFICRFHTIELDNKSGLTRDVIIGETLSVFPINYEYVNMRKRKSTMLSPKGKDNGLFWLSNFRFDCPVPDNGNLRKSIASGITVLPDGTPSIYVDVVPIRTNPRFGMEESYFTEDLVGPDYFRNSDNRKPKFKSHETNIWGFDAKTVFGDTHVLPRVEASGRWANIPICTAPKRPPTKEEFKLSEEALTTSGGQFSILKVEDTKDAKKPFTSSACVWASASFDTRGGDRKVDDTMERTREWIEYHLLMGFDHIYIYDNSGANTNETDLVKTLSPFSAAEVTRIEWPSIVCNNNLPAHENTGERSSQYAAESSCRQRYGQYTEWIAAFDTDEYFVPMGKYGDLRTMLTDAKEEGTNILSFKSTRAYPNYYFMDKYGNGGECGQVDDPKCLRKMNNATFLETYNCDFVPLPKPEWAVRAKKQFYRPNYVLSHFVHYSTVTKGILQTYREAKTKGRPWHYWYAESAKSERLIDELKEAVMIHSKTTVPGNTKGYWKTCILGFKGKFNEKCRVGFPILGNVKVDNATTPEGYEFNCYTNERVTNLYAPKLREAMNKRTGRFLDLV